MPGTGARCPTARAVGDLVACTLGCDAVHGNGLGRWSLVDNGAAPAGAHTPGEDQR